MLVTTLTKSRKYITERGVREEGGRERGEREEGRRGRERERGRDLATGVGGGEVDLARAKGSAVPELLTSSLISLSAVVSLSRFEENKI